MHDTPTTHRAPLQRRWPQDIWNHLTGLDARLLEQLAFLARLQRARSPKGAAYCTPGRAWLATRLDCHPDTISRHTAKLQALGILDKRQRRPISGIWQTCLYAITSPLGWRFAALRATIARVANRLTNSTDLASSKRGIKGISASASSLADVLARGRLKFCAPTL